MFSEGIYTITATVRDDVGNLTSAFANITVTNTAPVIESFTANATRNMKDGRFYADLSAVVSDPDGDTVTLEWGSDYVSSGWYSRNGTHTIRVRAVDTYDAASPWQEKTIEFVNQAPSKPVISRNPANGLVRPGQALTITASSTDPEGDSITYEWEGRDAETATYGYGKHLIKCRAVDAYGAASPWSAIMFFVADDVGGGMTLTSASSFIEETGISFEDRWGDDLRLHHRVHL